MRPDIDAYFLAQAVVIARRSTCVRRAVGCVLVDARRHALATGYNGVPAGAPHCNEGVPQRRADSEPGEVMPPCYPHACAGAFSPSGGTGDGCGAVHAEINALLQCRDVYQVSTVYVTAEPCGGCAKALVGTSAERVVFLAAHPSAGRDHWARSGRDLGAWVLADEAVRRQVQEVLTEASRGLP